MGKCSRIHLWDRLDDRNGSKCNAVINRLTELIEITLADHDFTAE